MEEKWKEVNLDIDLRWKTEISNKGNVRKYVGDKVVSLKSSINSRGYLGIYLRCVSSRPQYTIHRLVALTFMPEGINEVVNHIDGNTLNNEVSNLEWTTRKENTRHGKLVAHKKRVCDLSNDDILNIIDEYLHTETTLVKLSEKWGVGRETMRTIITFKSKKILSPKDYVLIRNRHVVIRELKKQQQVV